MVTRNVRIRTPRKTKTWTQSTTRNTFTDSTLYPRVERDLLAEYKSDRGINFVERLTVMRIIADLRPYNNTETNTFFNLIMHYGIAWVPQNVVSASDGDAQIPDPVNPGTREIPWIHRGHLAWGTATGVDMWAHSFGSGAAGNLVMAHLDITQQRKQPTNDHQLVLITRVQDENSPVGQFTNTLVWHADIMLALP